jgi:hypothetical protein
MGNNRPNLIGIFIISGFYGDFMEMPKIMLKRGEASWLGWLIKGGDNILC